ncbi:ABC transporter permease [Devriesea agamarum]|uniref:ABC transporter permease n=1 Tax=Devriesea agamarum TaxID=472569 RepID=UPI00071D64EF|nr:ABC transporter permease [Devriesea agamarum]
MSIAVPSRVERAEGWRSPGQDSGWLNPFVNRFLLHLLVKKELRVRYRGSMLGMAWSYVKPAVQFIVFYIALGVFLELNKGVHNYAVYLFSGIVVINLFGETLGNCTRSITGNDSLVRKIYLPTELFPYSSMIVALIHFIPQLLVLAVGALLVGWSPGLMQLGAIALGLIILIMLTLGLGMLTAALNAAFRDIENFVDMIVMVLTWTSPIMYQITKVRHAVGDGVLYLLYSLNPLTIVVELFHYGFWQHTDGVQLDAGQAAVYNQIHGLWWAGLLIALAVFVIGNFVFERSKRSFAQTL